MKKIRKALLFGLAFLGVGAITACNDNKTDATVEVQETVEKILLPQNDTKVTGDFEVPATVKYNDEKVNITWSSSKDVITFKTVDGKTTAVVDFINNRTADQEVVLTATIKIGDVNASTTFIVTVPKFTVNTLAEADAAAAKTNLTLKGVIVAKEAFSNKKTNVYLMCEGGGFEAYNLACETQDKYDTELAVGNTIYVSGPKGYYNGLRELSGCTYIYDANTAKQGITAENLTSVVAAGNGIADTYQCHLAKLENVEIIKIGTPDASGQYSITVGDPDDETKQTVVRISKYFFTGKSATDYAFKDLNLVAGQKITVTGIVGWYNGAQLTPIAADGIVAGAIDYGKVISTSYVNAAIKAIGAQTIPMKTIILPSRLADVGLSGEDYEKYTIEWTTEDTNVTISTADIPAKEAVEAREATETEPAVEAQPAEAAYTQYSVTTKKPAEDADVTLTITVRGTEDNSVTTKTVTFKLLKEVTYNTYAEFVAAEDASPLYIQGTIVGYQYTSNVKKYYIQDADGNVYYVKSEDAVETNEWFKVGTKVGLFGKKLTENKIPTLDASVYLETLGTDGTVTYADYNETFSTTGITKEVVEAALLKPVTFSGVLKSVSGSNYVVTVGSGDSAKDITVYTYVATKPSFTANDKVKVSGLLGFYYKSSDDSYTYQVFLLDTAKMESAATDAEKLASAKAAVLGAFSDETYKETTQVQLSVKFNATIELNEALDESGVLAWDQVSKKVTITPTSELAEKTLKLKITVGTASEVVEIAIKAQKDETQKTLQLAFPTETTNFTADTDIVTTIYGSSASGVSVVFTKNNASSTSNITSDMVKLYQNDVLTFTAATGWKIDKIEVETSANQTANYGWGKLDVKIGETAVSNSDGTDADKTATFSVDGSTITFTATAQVRFKVLKIYLVKTA